MEINNSSGKPSAEEIQEMEKNLDKKAEESVDDKEKKPSDIDVADDEDDSEKSDKKDSKKKSKSEKDDDQEDEEEDDDDDIDDDDLEDEEDDDEDEEEDDDDDAPKGKKLPAWQVKMQERRLNKAKTEIESNLRKEFEEKYGRKPTTEEKQEMKDSLAEDFEKEFGVEPDEKTLKFLKFLEGRTKKFEMPPEMSKRLEKIEKHSIEQAEEIGFENDFAKQKKLINKFFPDADEKTIDRIKGKVKELAYTEKYAKYDLSDIIRLNRKALTPVERRKTGESSKGGHGQARYTPDQIDPEKIDWASMSVEEAEKTMDMLEKQQGKKSRVKIYRKGQLIN